MTDGRCWLLAGPSQFSLSRSLNDLNRLSVSDSWYDEAIRQNDKEQSGEDS